jgi:hypothetical protein
MKKIAIIGFIWCFALSSSIFAQEQWTKFLGNDTFEGKLEWTEFGDFPYIILDGKKLFAIRVDLDNKTNKNDQIHKLVGKKVHVSGPMYIVTVNTEYKNLKFIDLRKGKGSIKEVK